MPDTTVVVDCETGDEQERPLTAEEQAQRAQDAQEAQVDHQEREADEQATEAAAEDARSISAVLQTLDDATKDRATWDGLTAAQRQEATRVAIRGFVLLARFAIKRFLS